MPLRKNKFGTDPADTVIAEEVKLTGNLVCDANLWFGGQLVGNVKSQSDVHITKTASVEGNIDCVNLTLAGRVRGNLRVKNRLNLESTAEITGDIMASDLEVTSGAIVSGNLAMPKSATATTSEPAADTSRESEA